MTTALATAPSEMMAGDFYPTYHHQWWEQPYWPVTPTYVYPSVNWTISQTPRCAWCQGTHTDKCANLKAVTYRPDGTVERVEFFGEKDHI